MDAMCSALRRQDTHVLDGHHTKATMFLVLIMACRSFNSLAHGWSGVASVGLWDPNIPSCKFTHGTKE